MAAPASPFVEFLRGLPVASQLKVLFEMNDDLRAGRDETLARLKPHADAVGAELILVGGIAVIRNGYLRTTADRDVLVNRREAVELANRLMDDGDWDRLEIREFAFVYRPTGVEVDFVAGGDLMDLGAPYLFPWTSDVESAGEVEGIPVVGLHDLLYLKLVAGRARDVADVMELCKLHLDTIDTDKVVARLEPEDARRDLFADILRRAPLELESERRLGRGKMNPDR